MLGEKGHRETVGRGNLATGPKMCTKCGLIKERLEFRKKKNCGVQPTCKCCENIKATERRAKRAAEIKQIIKARKAVPCMDCDQQYPSYVMDFDHRESSKKNFNIGIGPRFYNKKAVLLEIEKCDVVCANCHRVRTHEKKTGSVSSASPEPALAEWWRVCTQSHTHTYLRGCQV